MVAVAALAFTTVSQSAHVSASPLSLISISDSSGHCWDRMGRPATKRPGSGAGIPRMGNFGAHFPGMGFPTLHRATAGYALDFEGTLTDDEGDDPRSGGIGADIKLKAEGLVQNGYSAQSSGPHCTITFQVSAIDSRSSTHVRLGIPSGPWHMIGAYYPGSPPRAKGVQFLAPGAPSHGPIHYISGIPVKPGPWMDGCFRVTTEIKGEPEPRDESQLQNRHGNSEQRVGLGFKPSEIKEIRLYTKDLRWFDIGQVPLKPSGHP